MSVKELFQAGKLDEAVEAQIQQVKSKPTSTEFRTLLFELLSFQGQLERADKQLEVIAQQDENANWATQVYRNLIKAEQTRQKLFTEGLKPGFLLDPPDYIHLHLDAINRLREEQPAEARTLLEKSESACPDFSGTHNDQPFEGFRDCDDLFAPILELFVLFDYIWLPFEQIQELEISRPEHPRDLLWTPVRIVLADGSQRRGYVPALYADTHQQDDAELKLGRMTDWQAAEDGPVTGLGRRQYLVGDENPSILEIGTLQFHKT